MRYIIGIDEAGRGPLAGPVSVGLVMAREDFDIVKEFVGVNDSKKLSEKKREEIYEMLKEREKKGDIFFTAQFGSPRDIDEQGIAVVIKSLIVEGIERLRKSLNVGFTKSHIEKPEIQILLDGALRAPSIYFQKTIIHGDALVPIISLASIVAKVERDHKMVALSGKYKEYDFYKHKGYGTVLHYEKIKKYGLCDIHRKSFIHLDLDSK